MSDDFRLELCSDNVEHLEPILTIAFSMAPGKKATHWAELADSGLTMFWSDPQNHTLNASPFPSPLFAASAKSIILDWLKAQTWSTTGHYVDVLYKRGFYIKCWAGNNYKFLSIKPMWMEYHK